MPDIFLSYNREDQARARLFAEAFQAQGFEVWWDATLRSGEAYDQVTEKALKEAKAVVVLWSTRSVESRWVRAEATLAHRNNTLIPVMIEMCERPIMFELTQTADLTHWQGARDDAAWVAFLGDLRRLVGAPPRTFAVTPQLLSSSPTGQRPLEPVIAVLAFDNLSDDREMQFFSDGISEEIIQRLSRGTRMKVIGRASSFQFRGARKTEAPRALNCSHVLDGSVRRSGDKVRIVVQLVEAATHTTLWSDRYDRSLEDVFALQDEISRRIAAALNRAIAKTTTYAIDAQSFDLYLRSRAQRFTPDGWRTSITLLESVVRRRPQFAPAWGWLAHLKSLLRWSCAPNQFAALTASANLDVRRALAIDPTDLTALSGQYLLTPPWGAFLEGEEIIAKMASGTSNDSELVAIALFSSRVGHLCAARDSAWRFYELDPLNPLAIVWLGACLMRRGQLAESREVFERALMEDPRGDVVNLIITHAFLQDTEAADRLMASVQYRDLPEPERASVTDFVMAARDPSGKGEQLVASIREEVDRTGAIDLRDLSLLAYFGAVDEAYAIAPRVRFRPIGDGTELKGIRAYQSWNLFAFWAEKLRQDQRFPALCARLGLVEYWTATGKWPDCVTDVPYDFRAECASVVPA